MLSIKKGFMNIIPVTNWREEDGEFRDPNFICSVCGKPAEVFAEYYKGSSAIIRICKTCTWESLELIDLTYQEEFKKLEIR